MQKSAQLIDNYSDSLSLKDGMGTRTSMSIDCCLKDASVTMTSLSIDCLLDEEDPFAEPCRSRMILRKSQSNQCLKRT